MSSIENNDYYSVIRKILDEIDEVILKRYERENSKTINVKDNYADVSHDQRDKSIINLVDVTAGDEPLHCTADAYVKNKKDDNDNICSVADLSSQETMISDFSDDDESPPKKSKQFTFRDNDLPESREIDEFLKAYPRPQVTFFPWIESESKSYLDEESNWFSRRRRKKIKPVTKITIENLPERFMTRQRKPNMYLVTKKYCHRVLQSIYLKKQENQIDLEIIRENIQRLKMSNNNKIPENMDTKSKSFAINNITLDIISTAKKSTRGTSYMKNKSDGKQDKNKSISSGNEKKSYKRKHTFKKNTCTLPAVERRRSKRNQKTKGIDEVAMKAAVSVAKIEDKNNKSKSTSISSRNEQNDYKRKHTHKKNRSTLPAVERRRSKRNQKTKGKDEDTMKAPVSVPKKSVHEQSTVYNISSSSCESPKSLKRSLVEDSDVPSAKRTRFHDNKVTKASMSTSASMGPTEKTLEFEPDKRVRNILARRGRKTA
ncbi:hypothetical protein PYW08_011628 [Mythimna loreyi]|uniref:Uncharacterized protein n=1 Tax=Mythimna loreyi TaxID=667449 RepID=A0ACC2QKY9_9NEOP|nr:hypothetical protein PYW08_011628 [Mythimna loreyi]